MTLTRESFEKLYRSEQDVKTKERMLLVLNVVYRGKVSAPGSRYLHRSKAWAWDWLKRYDKEGINGLKTRQKCGRPTERSKEVVYRIKEELKESKQDWTIKQVEELIIKKSGIKYHYIHIYRILRKWGLTKGAKKDTCKHNIQRRERGFQKKVAQRLMDRKQQQQQQQQEKEENEFYRSIPGRIILLL